MKIIGGILLIIAAIIVAMIFLGFGMFLLGILALGAIAWACGVPIKITKNGEYVGYVRWTKFHPK